VKILNRREGERLTLHQSQYLKRKVVVNRAPRQENNRTALHAKGETVFCNCHRIQLPQT